MLHGIKNLIFDVGDVLIDIDFQEIIRSFQKIAKADLSNQISYYQQTDLFDKFEKGEILAKEFRDNLREKINNNISDDEIDFCWNSILVGYPSEKFELLKVLRTQFKLYALSNINELHLAEIDNQIQTRFGKKALADYFDTVFYSHKMGCRKPELKIYEQVLQTENLNPFETLFIDDKWENIAAAQKTGFRTLHLTNRDSLVPIFKNFLPEVS